MTTIAELDPRDAASRLLEARGDAWVAELAQELDHRLSGRQLDRVLGCGPVPYGAGRAVRCQSAGRLEVDPRRRPQRSRHGRADIEAITDLLERYLKRDRIAAVVRRRADRLDDHSLLELVGPDVPPRRSAHAADVHLRRPPPMIAEDLADEHRWLRICEASWDDPLDDTFAQGRGGRWNPAGSWRTLYLNEDRVTARLNLDRFISGWPYEPEDLDARSGPHLVEALLPRSQTVGTCTHQPESGPPACRRPTRWTAGERSSADAPSQQAACRSTTPGCGACIAGRPRRPTGRGASSPGSRRRGGAEPGS